jgi:hypothetical protein
MTGEASGLHRAPGDRPTLPLIFGHDLGRSGRVQDQLRDRISLEISERWLALISIVFALLRLTMSRWRSGSIVRSCVNMAYQLGFDRQSECRAA